MAPQLIVEQLDTVSSSCEPAQAALAVRQLPTTATANLLVIFLLPGLDIGTLS